MDNIDVTQEFIKTLEENVFALTKNKMVLDTNVSVLNKILEGKDNKIKELDEIIRSKDDEYNRTRNHLENELRKVSEELGFKKSDLKNSNNLIEKLQNELADIRLENIQLQANKKTKTKQNRINESFNG